MNDTNFETNVVKVDVPDGLVEAAVNAIKPPIQTFQDIWFLVFGGVSQAAEKKRIQYAAELEEFKKSIQSRIEAIPEDRRNEPDIQLVGQALEDSRYCVGSKELRDMFANLISSSIDNSHKDSVHPSFSKMLQQMSPMDAKMLSIFAARIRMPVAEYRIDKNSSSFETFYQNVPALRPIDSTFEQAVLSITALERLGLISLPDGISFTNDALYQGFYRTQEYQALQAQAEKRGGKASIHKGLARLSPLGKAFISICLPGPQRPSYISL